MKKRRLSEEYIATEQDHIALQLAASGNINVLHNFSVIMESIIFFQFDL